MMCTVMPCKDGRKTGLAQTSFGYIRLHHGAELLHRIEYASFHNITLKKGDVVRHRCDNPWCIEVSHLLLGTQLDNIRDTNIRGRARGGSNKGQDHPAVQLTEDEVLEIRRRYADGETGVDLAREYGVGKSTVYSIVNRVTWRHI